MPIYIRDQVQAYIASAATLLAMKLKAVIRRGLRELEDLRVLLALTGIETVDAADDLMEAFYPANTLTEKARSIVQVALDTLPAQHRTPEVSDLG